MLCGLLIYAKADWIGLRWVWKKWNGPKQLEDKKTKSLMMLPYVSSVFLYIICIEGTCIPLSLVRIILSRRTRASRNTLNLTLTTRIFSSRSKSRFADEVLNTY